MLEEDGTVMIAFDPDFPVEDVLTIANRQSPRRVRDAGARLHSTSGEGPGPGAAGEHRPPRPAEMGERTWDGSVCLRLLHVHHNAT